MSKARTKKTTVLADQSQPLVSPVSSSRRQTPLSVPVSIYVECLCAAHLSSYVESPFTDRGGIMVVGPPGVLKTTLVTVLDRQYHDVLVMSDLNMTKLTAIREQIGAGNIRTLVMPELAKLYARHVHTAANVEGVLAALAAEGFRSASFEDERANRYTARATIIAALVPSFLMRQFSRWEESGFSRRFIWSFVKLSDPYVLTRAYEQWTRINFAVGALPRPPVSGDSIPNLLTDAERRELVHLVKHQYGAGSHEIQLQLLARMVNVLRWHYMETKSTRDAMETVTIFARTLGTDAGELVI